MRLSNNTRGIRLRSGAKSLVRSLRKKTDPTKESTEKLDSIAADCPASKNYSEEHESPP